MTTSLFRDIGEWITALFAASGIATAAGAGDATEVDGAYVDRQNYLSAKLVITGQAVLQQDETLSIAANLQDAIDDQGTGVADFGDAFANAVVATGGAGGSTESFEVEIDVDLSSARQYVRAQVTPNLSASGTDTLRWAAAWIVGPTSQQT